MKTKRRFKAYSKPDKIDNAVAYITVGLIFAIYVFLVIYYIVNH